MSAASEPAASVKVLFIAGTGRSGTTILSNILGQSPGCFSGGEVRYVWERGLIMNNRCGCGEFFRECPVWTSVFTSAFGESAVPDAAALVPRLERRLRVRQVPLMLWRWMRGRPVLKPQADDTDIRRVYEALSKMPGVAVVVDSSKLPPYGMLLQSLPGLELYVVHVVRDPRATAFSWRRTKATHDTAAAAATMPRLENWRSAGIWTLWNLLTDLWWRPSTPRRILVRYEDLVQDPAATVRRVLQMVGAELPTGVISGHRVSLSATHSVAGNPNRHQSGAVELCSDDEWRQAMRRSERALVTALTAPGLRRFGYRIGTRPRRGRRPGAVTR